MEYNESEFFIETEIPSDELIISRTDLNGVITFANDVFCDISGYDEEEIIGQNHNLVRHPDMPQSIFKDLWYDLKHKGKWSGIVKNMRKDKGFYWVNAIVSCVYKKGELLGYKSIRTPITSEEKLKHQKMYDKIRQENGEAIRTVIYK